MKHDMVPALEHIVVIKIAVQINNYSELKREILCAPGSEYDINKTDNVEDRKTQWQETVLKKATVLMTRLTLPELLRQKVIGFIVPIGMRMLNWATYHEGSLGFTRENSINFLNSSLFTQLGIVDNKKAAEHIINDESLNNKQKFNLACLYCSTDHISDFYKKRTREDKVKFYSTCRWIREPNLVTFWSYYLRGKVDVLRGSKSVHLFRLQKAIESGSKAAVEYCFQATNFTREKDLIDAAVEAVKNKIVNKNDDVQKVFESVKLNGVSNWAPSDFYIDILCFLLSKMTVNTEIEFLKEDTKVDAYRSSSSRHYGVLEYFLNWPYQDYFIKTTEIMWDILPKINYAVLLINICEKIEPKKFNDRHVSLLSSFRCSIPCNSDPFGDEKTYDYRIILEKLWFRSPEQFKRYVFHTHDFIMSFSCSTNINVGVGVLIYLLTLNDFTDKDRKIIRLILASATDEDKKNITTSKAWVRDCVVLVEEKKREIRDRIDEICFPSMEKELNSIDEP